MIWLIFSRWLKQIQVFNPSEPSPTQAFFEDVDALRERVGVSEEDHRNNGDSYSATKTSTNN